MLYGEIYFLKMPFTRGGQRRPYLLTNINDIWDEYGVHAYIKSGGFPEFQFTPESKRILVENIDDIVEANYVVTVNSVVTDSYNAYWIDGITPLFTGSTTDTTPALVDITEDLTITEILNHGLPKIAGKVLQTTETLTGIYGGGKPPVQGIFNPGTYTRYVRHNTGPLAPYWAVGVYSTANFDLEMLVADYTTVADGEFAWEERAQKLATLASITRNDKDENVSLIALYAFPLSWIAPYVGTGRTTGKTVSGEAVTFSTFRVVGTTGGLGGDILAETLTTYIPHVYDKVYYQTSGHFVEIKPEINNGEVKVTIPIYISIPCLGDFSSAIKVYAMVNGVQVDLSNDFKLDFVINETALQTAQSQVATGINVAANVIGAVGGVAGGIASGNYFGAVQSLVGGASGISDHLAQLAQPAQTQATQSAASAAINLYGGECIVFIKPTNSAAIEAEIARVGLFYDRPPYIDDITDLLETENAFVKMDTVEIADALDTATAEAFVEELKRGVKVYPLTTS